MPRPCPLMIATKFPCNDYRTCLTNRMGSISRHIMPLVINSLGGGHTHTHTHTHTHKHTHKHTYRRPHRNNYKKPGAHRPPGLHCMDSFFCRYNTLRNETYVPYIHCHHRCCTKFSDKSNP